ncbi:CBS domain-containing protein [Bacillus sp. AGMB 02131]|uniref:CBS domain-containing protein n=1 Tax=Peribacillus faecalis TaxID=2772559 RepID=A0A927CSV4_9BACI|nr:cyclic-di-AMP-binding protein CbpB [Peribacillus faecalis]MBD3106903.1 CBS domain-containing protein [Peribacillus faecalis]
MLTCNNDGLLSSTIENYIISAERVAHVQVDNSLEHGLLVLTKSGYTAIPVLDPQYKLHGLISLPLIFDRILGIQRIEFEKLEILKVRDVMNADIARLKQGATLEEALDLLIDHPFICIENDEGVFEGILTRRAILKELQDQVKTKKEEETNKGV